MKRFIITIVLLLTFIVGFGLYYYEGNLPKNSGDTEKKTFVVEKGSSVNEIINKLYKEDFIRNKLVFYVLVKQLGIENKIQAGLFRISPSMTPKEIAISLTQGSDDIWITIIEGIRKEEVAQILAPELEIPESEFIRKAEEGTLFPDTYLIPRTATLDQVLGIFRTNFDKKYSEELRTLAQNRGLTDNQVLTLASMVEREANTPEAMQQVASIMVKRWKNDWPLEIDATVQYILGYQEAEGTWWKKNLTNADLATPSLYNTYLHPGLPPAPIASPGLEAIKAVLYANENTPYWFYISNKEGSQMHYAKTIEEHNENIRKYLR
jgi:UPF0755 protein